MKFNNRGVYISPNANIGENVRIGDNTIVHDNVTVGNNSIICNDCVLGEPLYSYYNEPNYTNPPLSIGEGALIRSHSILYAGSSFGPNLATGHRVTVREGTQAGRNAQFGTLTDIQGNCVLGDYVRLHSNVHIGQLTRLGNFVFVFPYTVFTNDPLPPSNSLVGSTVGDYSVITVHCTVLPGVTLGEHCLLGANSVISRDLESYSFAIGSPAKRKCDIREIPSKEDKDSSHYPWPLNFERGMPWEELGFAAWESKP